MSVATRAILSTFFEEQENAKPPTTPFGMSPAIFHGNNLSRNSCLQNKTDEAVPQHLWTQIYRLKHKSLPELIFLSF